MLCSSDRRTATSEPVKECLQRVVRWYFVGSSGNCFLPSCKRIEREADNALYLSFLWVCASSFDHCGNGLGARGGGRISQYTKAGSSCPLVASLTPFLLLLSNKCMNTHPAWTGILYLTNTYICGYHGLNLSGFSGSENRPK